MKPAWAVLIALLLALLVATLATDRAARPPDAGEEPTYALQAASLAWDFDLQYSDEDFRRFRDQWGARPRGIDLESQDGGRTQVYARPFFHALVAAPFVRLMPERGMRVANALLLAAAALLAAWALRAPLLVAAFVFASVTFSYVFLATADVFLLAVTAAGFALIYAGQREDPLPSVYEGERKWSWRVFGRWLAIGLLLAISGTYRLLYFFLLLPAAVALQKSVVRGRRAAWAGLILGAAGLLAAGSFVHASAGGDPLLAPSVTFEPDPGLLVWNAVYFLVGRNVGILPWFLPVLLALAAARSDRGRWALGVGVALAVLGFLVADPYDFAGVGGGAGNRLFLPLYPALWFLAARPLRSGWVIAVALLAAPFLLPLSPSVKERIEAWLPYELPYEVTQRDLPGAWIAQGSLRIKPTSPGVWKAPQGSDFRIAGGEGGELVIASPDSLERLELAFDRNAPALLEVHGAELRPTRLGADGSVTFQVPLGSGRVHPMWWTGDRHHLYSLNFRLPGAPIKPIGFRVRPVRDLIQKTP
ncbi:MAG TPA: hypothetical protein VN493_24470 [Thermoanaerobaculia bacterium]|nr:hypothetical protein [Thermoanaerobaculia bacterium]